MADLDRLIKLTENPNHFLIQTVKYPNFFRQSLLELKETVIGLGELKDAIAGKLVKLMMDTHRTRVRKMEMINTMLYGPPGVGKTSVSIILAKIWFAMGYLKGPTQPIYVPSAAANPKPASPKDLSISMGGEGLMNNPWTYLGAAGVSKFNNVMASKNSVKESTPLPEASPPTQEVVLEAAVKKGLSWSQKLLIGLVIVLILCLIGYGIYYWFYKPKKVAVPQEETFVPNTTRREEPIPDPRTLYRIVTRGDFIAEFVGHTESKTRALLESSRGKVLIVDEAYSLIQGNDGYGKIALTEINMFMSMYPEDIAFIFAGYKDKMLSGIMKEQPGLDSRFNLKFDCPGYNPEELWQIFQHQAQTKQWTFKQVKKCKRLFLASASLYKSFARDTGKLLDYITTEHDRELIFGQTEKKTKQKKKSDIFNLPADFDPNQHRTLTPRHVKQGIYTFMDNVIQPGPAKNPLETFQDLLGGTGG